MDRVGIRVEGPTMGVYINGKVVLDTSSPMFQNKIMEILMLTPTEVTPDYERPLYHNKALTGVEIMDIVRAGPDHH